MAHRAGRIVMCSIIEGSGRFRILEGVKQSKAALD
jgi:hypothetical protein